MAVQDSEAFDRHTVPFSVPKFPHLIRQCIDCCQLRARIPAATTVSIHRERHAGQILILELSQARL